MRETLNSGEWSDEHIKHLDFSWGVFFVRYVLAFEDRVINMRKSGIQPTFMLVDYQRDRLPGR